jgi:hypothetical protein
LYVDHYYDRNYKNQCETVYKSFEVEFGSRSIGLLSSLFFERKVGRRVKLPHHFTGQFGNPMDAAQESGTWGDEGKAVGCVPPTALLFEQHSILRVIKAVTSRARRISCGHSTGQLGNTKGGKP